MKRHRIPKDIYGNPLVFHFDDGTALCSKSSELCLRHACIHTGRLPAFIFSQELQYNKTRYVHKCATPIILPHIGSDSTTLFEIHIPTLPEHVSSEIARKDYPMVPEEEFQRLLRERKLVIEEDDCLSYIALSPHWKNDIRQQCTNRELVAAAWRVSVMLGRNLPDLYSHPLQANLAVNCKEVLGSTILPHTKTSDLPAWIANETDPTSLLCFARLSFYSLLCSMPPLAIYVDHPFRPFTGFCELMLQISKLLDCTTGPPLYNPDHFVKLIALLREDPSWEEAAMFCLSAAWPNLNSPHRTLLREILSDWIPERSHKWNWDIRKAMINEALWDMPTHIREDWAVRSSASVASFFININMTDNAARIILEYTPQDRGVQLLHTPLAAELIRCLDDSGTAKTTGFGETVLEKYTISHEYLACEPLVRVALANAYMGAGNYARAGELLKPVLHTSKTSTYLKMLVSLRLNKAERRSDPGLDLSILGSKSSLKFVLLHLEKAPHSLRIVCLSELVATLNELHIPGKLKPTSWALLHLAWRRFKEDRSLKLDWRYQVLQSLMVASETVVSVIEKSPGKQDSDFLKEFHNWIQISKLSGITGIGLGERVDFIPESEVFAFFEDDKNYESILTFTHLKNTSFLKKRLTRSFPKVICILLLLRRYDLISGLASLSKIDDSQLPYLKDHGMPDWVLPDDTEFWDQFCRVQWMFCVKPLRLDGGEIQMQPEYILPVKHTQYAGVNACAVIDKATIHEFYSEDNSGANNHDQTVYALKIFASSRAKQHYEAELQAFKRLSEGVDKSQSIIEFFGGIHIGDTFAILLEYADMGDLESHMRQVSPPTSGEEMNWLWSQLLRLGSALAYLHSIPYRGENENLLGWHHDIMPSNVLVTNSPDGIVFKLANIGLSHLMNSCVQDILEWDSFSTGIYGAPERSIWETYDNEADPKAGQTADVWSLGCIYSEVATWSAFGYLVLEKYRHSREREIRDISGFTCIGCFHNGHNALSAVASSHSKILAEAEYEEPMKMLQLVEHMLLPKESRVKSHLVAEISVQVLHKGFSSIEQSFLRLRPQTGPQEAGAHKLVKQNRPIYSPRFGLKMNDEGTQVVVGNIDPNVLFRIGRQH